jgi:conjugal transfer pilus assembly protein TraV
MRFLPSSMAPAARARRAFAFAATFALAGCASIAGVGGSAEFGCKAPLGVKCDSVSGTYYNAVQQNLPSQQKGTPPIASGSNTAPTLLDRLAGKRSRSTGSSNDAQPRRTLVMPAAIASVGNAPLRSPPRVLRLWIKPWEDSDGDLHTQSYVYVPIDSGRWLIDHRVLPTRDAYRPTKATRASARTTPMAEPPVTATALRPAGGTPVLSASPEAASVPQQDPHGDDDGR